MADRLRVVVDMFGRRMDEIFSAHDRRRLFEVADVVWARDEVMPAALARKELEGADVVVCPEWRYGDLKDHYHNLRAVIDVAGGIPHALDYETAFQRGIHVLTAAPGFARQVAEAALAMALASCREIPLGDRAMRARHEGYMHAGNKHTFMLFDKPVGFVGYGSIARALQPLIEPFHCPIAAYDPWLGDGYLRHCGVTPASLERLMEASQFVFVLAAPSSQNAELLNREMLERLRPDSVLVLMSRAHVVDFDALTECLAEKRFRAAVDVFPAEPLPADHPIRDLDSVVLSAHRAGSVKEGMWDLGALVVDDLEMIAKGMPPRRLQPAARELVSHLVR